MNRHTPQGGDQAQGLRALFRGPALSHIGLVANPYLDSAEVGVVLERITAALGLLGRRTLVIDASDTSPHAPEGVAIDLGMCIESLSPDIWYLPARGLPKRFVDTRGSSAGLIEQAVSACHGVDVVLVHATAPDLARLYARGSLRPLYLAADQPESVKHAYAAMKLFAQRCQWLSADLMLVGTDAPGRLPHIATSLTSCAEAYVGVTVTGWASVDPRVSPADPPDPMLCRLVAGQLGINDAVSVAPGVKDVTNRGFALTQNQPGAM